MGEPRASRQMTPNPGNRRSSMFAPLAHLPARKPQRSNKREVSPSLGHRFVRMLLTGNTSCSADCSNATEPAVANYGEKSTPDTTTSSASGIRLPTVGLPESTPKGVSQQRGAGSRKLEPRIRYFRYCGSCRTRPMWAGMPAAAARFQAPRSACAAVASLGSRVPVSARRGASQGGVRARSGSGATESAIRQEPIAHA